MNKTDYPTATDLIDHKEQLVNALKTAERSAEHLSNDIIRLTSALREEKQAIPGLQSAVNRGDQQYQAALKNRLENVERIQADLNQANTEKAQLDAQIAELKAQINGLAINVSRDHVIEHQNAIAAKQGELTNLQKLIAEQRRVIEDESNHKDEVTPLLKVREELLADITLGQDKTADLVKLDKKINTAREKQSGLELSAKNAITNAQQAIAGLERRMNLVDDELTSLNNLTPKMLDLMLMSVADQAANDFILLADQLTEKMLDLLALDAIVLDIGQRQDSGLFHPNGRSLMIPLINGAKPLEHPKGAVSFYAYISKGMTPFADAASRIKQDLISQGIEI